MTFATLLSLVTMSAAAPGQIRRELVIPLEPVSVLDTTKSEKQFAVDDMQIDVFAVYDETLVLGGSIPSGSGYQQEIAAIALLETLQDDTMRVRAAKSIPEAQTIQTLAIKQSPVTQVFALATSFEKVDQSFLIKYDIQNDEIKLIRTNIQTGDSQSFGASILFDFDESPFLVMTFLGQESSIIASKPSILVSYEIEHGGE